MSDSKRIAGLLGPSLVVVSVTETLNLQIWRDVALPVVYLSGTLLFVAGLSIVLAHNRWEANWRVVVTLVGWVILLGGLIRMIAPGLAQSQAPLLVLPTLALLFATGIFLSLKSRA